jgi:hypothetical protein
MERKRLLTLKRRAETTAHGEAAAGSRELSASA